MLNAKLPLYVKGLPDRFGVVRVRNGQNCLTERLNPYRSFHEGNAFAAKAEFREAQNYGLESSKRIHEGSIALSYFVA